MPRFNRENAREFGHRGNVARWHSPTLPPEPPPLPPIAEGIADPDVVQRLACGRVQIGLLNGMLLKALQNPKTQAIDIERLSRSLTALNEIERKLAGRPDPGSYRPQVNRKSRTPVALPEPT